MWILTDGNSNVYSHIVESASGADILEIPLLFTQPDASTILVIAFALGKQTNNAQGNTNPLPVIDYFVYDLNPPYNTATYDIYGGTTVNPVFPLWNSTSHTYVLDKTGLPSYSSAPSNSMVLPKDNIHLFLNLEHWTKPTLGAIKSFSRVYMLQETTNALGATTIEAFYVDQGASSTIVASTSDDHIAPPPIPKTSGVKTTAKKTTATKTTAKKTTAKKTTAKKTTATKTAKKTTAKKTTAKKTATKTTAKKTTAKKTATKTAKKTTAKKTATKTAKKTTAKKTTAKKTTAKKAGKKTA